MRPAWESRKRRPRFILPVILSASMSACKSIEQLLSLSDGQLDELFVRHPGIGSLLPGGLNWRPCFPAMYPACHAKA